MDSDQLSPKAFSLFLQLYYKGSLSQSAAASGISLAKASRTLAQLRLAFDDELFRRCRTGLTPTQKAQELLPAVERLQDAYEKLTISGAFNPRNLRQTFRIGAVDNGVVRVLPRIFKAFFEIAPHCSLIVEAMAKDSFAKLRSGALDLIILPVEQLPPGFHKKELFSNDVALITGPKHPLVAYEQEYGDVPESELRRYRQLRIQLDHHYWRPGCGIDEASGVIGNEDGPAITIPFIVPVPMILESTDCWAMGPRATFDMFAKKGIVRILRCSKIASRHTRTNMVWHERSDKDPTMQWLRAFFCSYARQGFDPFETAQEQSGPDTAPQEK